ncbi:hypothetical protein VTK56DRAFT_7555 [Thermocarpiscus australiensis]
MPPRLGDNAYEGDDDDDDDERRALLDESRRRARRIVDGFIDFAFQGNVLEIAFGLILASMFTALVTSLVTDILLPPLSVLLPLNKNLEEKFAVLRPGPNLPADGGYNTLKQAQEDGAVVMAYGFFLNRLVNFMGVGFSLYGLAAVYQYFSQDPIIKHTVKCRYCRKRINEKAARCVNCTSWQDGREDQHFG